MHSHNEEMKKKALSSPGQSAGPSMKDAGTDAAMPLDGAGSASYVSLG